MLLLCKMSVQAVHSRIFAGTWNRSPDGLVLGKSAFLTEFDLPHRHSDSTSATERPAGSNTSPCDILNAASSGVDSRRDNLRFLMISNGNPLVKTASRQPGIVIHQWICTGKHQKSKVIASCSSPREPTQNVVRGRCV